MRLRSCFGKALLLAAVSAVPAVLAQDAQRWQEVEVVVFTHEDRASQVSERPLADPSRLGWLPRLTVLRTASDSLFYPFEPAIAVAAAIPQDGSNTPLLPATASPALPAAVPQAPVPAQPVFGPQPAPVAARSFRLPDQARDPWLALDDSIALLDQDARALAGSPQHRVLWHGTWRQPMLPAGRSQALLITGGDRYGERHELEGSLRVSDSGGRAQLDVHLWFSTFLAGFSTTETAWSLPPLPEPGASRGDSPAGATGAAETTEELGSWMSSGTWQLRDSTLLTLDATHYLDNPAIGVIVQIRPYAVPARELPGADEDF